MRAFTRFLIAGLFAMHPAHAAASDSQIERASLTGLAVMVWVRFVRFPPQFEVYELKLAKQRYFTRSKFAHPEATIRPKAARAGGSRPNAQRSRSNRGRRRR